MSVSMDSDPFSITKHVDYQKILATHISKEQCQNQIKKALKETPIMQNPQYSQIMNKYALRDNTTCPPTYKPCKNLSEYKIEDHPDFKNYVKASIAQAELKNL